MRLEGKVALISGGGRGMGAAEARLFASEGAKVVFGDVLEAEGQQVEAEIAEAGGEAVFVHLDVTSEADWQRAVDTAVERFGGLHILVNNAGIFDGGNVEAQTVEGWDRTMDINAKGVFLGTKAAIPAMRESGSGSIVNISSVAGIIGSLGTTAYNASKGAVRLLTKSTAIQYAAEGIRCNSVHPGPIDTNMIREAFPDDDVREARIGLVPLGRMGDMSDVANGVLFLASDEASYMTGSELVIDGGATAM
ncbi:MAG: glucose 1-dehydrogenase [Dehalococcoidia bacterium]|nr:glucose 1-dehydrogenase [Dehalococcoidia bacterium]